MDWTADSGTVGNKFATSHWTVRKMDVSHLGFFLKRKAVENILNKLNTVNISTHTKKLTARYPTGILPGWIGGFVEHILHKKHHNLPSTDFCIITNIAVFKKWPVAVFPSLWNLFHVGVCPESSEQLANVKYIDLVLMYPFGFQQRLCSALWNV